MLDLIKWYQLIIYLAPLFFWQLHLLKNKWFDSLVQKSVEKAVELGHVISISGEIGVGKTSLLNAFGHLLTIYLMDVIKERLATIRLIIHKLNYKLINDMIIDNKLLGVDEIYNLLTLDNQYMLQNYDDFINVYLTNYTDLIKEYIVKYKIYDDNCYLYAKTYFYSRITNNFSRQFNNDFLAIWKNDKFYIRDYTVILSDENALDRNNDKNHQEAKERNGNKDYLRLIRHLHQASVYYIYTVQDATEIIKKERSLATSNLFLVNKKIIVRYRIPLILLALLSAIMRFIFCVYALFRLQGRFKERYDILYLKPNVFKKIDRKIYIWRQKITQYNYIVIIGDLYKRSEHVYMQSVSPIKRVKFFVPIKYCYGVAPQYTFDALGDMLRSKFFQLPVVDRNTIDNELLITLDDNSSIRGVEDF